MLTAYDLHLQALERARGLPLATPCGYCAATYSGQHSPACHAEHATTYPGTPDDDPPWHPCDVLDALHDPDEHFRCSDHPQGYGGEDW